MIESAAAPADFLLSAMTLDSGNGKSNGFNSRLSTVFSWIAIFASIGIQAGILITKVNILGDEIKELKSQEIKELRIVIDNINARNMKLEYDINNIKYRLGWLDSRYSDMILDKRKR